MLGIVVPAHNEERIIGACLTSLRRASSFSDLLGEPVEIVVALDTCSDRTREIARAMGARTVSVEARNVGIARARGAAELLEAGARWLAFTDADTTVAPSWLHAQLALGTDAVCGTVSVGDWSVAWGGSGQAARRRFGSTYHARDGHRHVHGANLGVSAAAYQRVGGFEPLACGEDVALVAALERAGATVAWTTAPRVVTSARKDFRAPGGFGATLCRMAGLDRVDHFGMSA